jgi:hypothetical protein
MEKKKKNKNKKKKRKRKRKEKEKERRKKKKKKEERKEKERRKKRKRKKKEKERRKKKEKKKKKKKKEEKKNIKRINLPKWFNTHETDSPFPHDNNESSKNTPNQSIIPNSIHPKPRLLHIQMRDASQKLAFPAIHLHPALFIITQSEPLIGPRTRADGVGMAATSRGGIQRDLAFDLTLGAELEGGDVAGQVRGVAAGRGEEVGARGRAEHHV